MTCKKCNGNNVVVQAVTETKTKKKGILYWVYGWIFDLMAWIFLTLPRLIIAIFKPKKIISKTHKMAICQSCGYSWKVK